MGDPDPSSVAGWLQSGGVMAFAAAVWFELREQRKERNKAERENSSILSAIRETLAVIMDRERRRALTEQSHPMKPKRNPTSPIGVRINRGSDSPDHSDQKDDE